MTESTKKIYTPIGNADFVGGFKIKNKELTNQQFFDVLFTKYISFTLPVSENKKSSHIQINLYSADDKTLQNPFLSLDTTIDRSRFFGIDSQGFFNMPEDGFHYSHQGKPIFVDLQEYIHLTHYISWRTRSGSEWGEYYYSVFPSMNIDNYGNGKATSGGGGTGGDFQYDGYFAVTDASNSSKDKVNISGGVVYLNNKRYDVEEQEFELIDVLTGYVIDTKMYESKEVEIVLLPTDDLLSENPDIYTMIQGELTNEKLDPFYSIGTSKPDFPCELRLVISNYGGEFSYKYTLSKNNRTTYSTDSLIAVIDKNDDNSLLIKQQQFGEIEKSL